MTKVGNMKIKPRQFALSLYEAVDGKTPGQVKTVIEKFVELLAEKNMPAKAFGSFSTDYGYKRTFDWRHATSL